MQVALRHGGGEAQNLRTPQPRAALQPLDAAAADVVDSAHNLALP